MAIDLNKKTEEFELKYIIGGNEDETLLFQQIMDLFSINGYRIVSTSQKENCDEYFDTRNLDLYQKGGSLRIRKAIKKDKVKFKGTYKMPLDEETVFSSRTEIEESLPGADFEIFEAKMQETGVPVDFSQIMKKPLLNSTTRRIDVVLEKSGFQVCLSFDNSVYTNHFLDEITICDRMIEIEAVGEINNGTMLNEIHSFITKGMNNVTINKQSKYERGLSSTYYSHQQQSQEEKSELSSELCMLIRRLND